MVCTKGRITMTSLHWAAQKGDVDLAKTLLYAGANMSLSTSYNPSIERIFQGPVRALRPTARVNRWTTDTAAWPRTTCCSR